MSAFLHRVCAAEPEPVQPMLAFPPAHDPAYVVRGPDVARRYGSSKTQVCTRCGAWRPHSHVADPDPLEPWTRADDYRNEDNLVGKCVEIIMATSLDQGDRGVVTGLDENGFLMITLESGYERHYLAAKHVRVLESSEHLNPWQKMVTA